MSLLFSPIREFFKKGDRMLLFFALLASGYGLLLILSLIHISMLRFFGMLQQEGCQVLQLHPPGRFD